MSTFLYMVTLMSEWDMGCKAATPVFKFKILAES
jgi:hypothetical protein